jgi:transposase
MATETKPVTSCKRHSQQYKAEALALAEWVAVPTATKQLGLHESQLYSW